MITEFFLSIFTTIAQWFIGLFGTDGPPEWMVEFASFITELVARASGLGAWFPFVLFGTVFGAVIALWLALWGPKFIRWLWGLTPFSGGS